MARRKKRKKIEAVRAKKPEDQTKKINRFLIILLIVAAAIILFLLALLIFSKPQSIGILESYIPEFSGYDEVKISTEGTTIILTSGCLQIQATTTEDQALSIQQALQKQESFRPLSHDLAKTIFEEYGIEVLAVKIDSAQEGIYFSKLILQQGNKVLNVDARPSDAIAIALRFDKPIYMKKTLLVDLGSNVC